MSVFIVRSVGRNIQLLRASVALSLAACVMACSAALPAQETTGIDESKSGLAATQSSDEWIQLFNGKNMDGWTPKIRGEELGTNYNDTFQVEDGLLKVNFDKYENFDRRFGHLFYKDQFENYVLRVEYRFTGDQCPGGPGWAFRNSGMMLHCQDPASMEKDQDFPVSIEVQLLGGNGTDKRPTLNLCTPGTNVVYQGKLHKQHCTQSSSDTYHGDQWVTVEVEVHGGEKFIHRIDGQTVLEYTEPQLDPNDNNAKKLVEAADSLILSGGYISLQAESHPVEFRKVELKVLK